MEINILSCLYCEIDLTKASAFNYIGSYPGTKSSMNSKTGSKKLPNNPQNRERIHMIFLFSKHRVEILENETEKRKKLGNP